MDHILPSWLIIGALVLMAMPLVYLVGITVQAMLEPMPPNPPNDMGPG